MKYQNLKKKKNFNYSRNFYNVYHSEQLLSYRFKKNVFKKSDFLKNI